MYKKLAIAAISLPIAAAAAAQSNVSVYGVVDMGYRWAGKNLDAGVGSRIGLDSGIQSGSRLGFKGTEDLGNGLKASFVLEQSLAVDTGTGADWKRQAFLALSGDFGSMAFGRQQTPQYLFAGQFDPFANATDATMVRTYIYNARLDNMATYVSPDWGGFSFIAGYSFNGIGDENKDNDVADARIIAFAPMFTAGDFSAAVNIHQVRMDSSGGTGNSDGEKVTAYDLFAAYDFGAVKLSGAIGRRNASETDFAVVDYGSSRFTDAEDSTQYMLGLKIPVGSAGNILASYVHRKTDLLNDDTAKVDQFGLGYTHALSKRTNLYAAYSHIKNNSDARQSTAYSDINKTRYQRAFNLGIRHKF